MAALCARPISPTHSHFLFGTPLVHKYRATRLLIGQRPFVLDFVYFHFHANFTCLADSGMWLVKKYILAF